MIDNRTAPYAALCPPTRAVVLLFRASDQEVRRDWLRSLVEPDLVKQGYPGVVLGYTVAIEFAGGALLAAPRRLHPLCQFAFAPSCLIAVANHWMVRKGFWFARWRHGISACLGVHADRTGSARVTVSMRCLCPRFRWERRTAGRTA